MSISQFPPSGGDVPTGEQSARPSSPVIGDVFYNGTSGMLEIYSGTTWVPCSAPASQPTITVADVGTGVAYGASQALVTFTEGTIGGKAVGFTATATTGGYTATSTSSSVTVTTGNNGNYTFTGTAYNAFGTSPASPSSSATLTSVPQAPTIGTATVSGSNINVTWTLGNDGGKNLTSIIITPYIGSTAQTPVTAATTSSTSVSISGLTPGTAYTFKVKAANANGTGLESSASNSATIPVAFTADFLVVAGGGAGGRWIGAGGGAGGLRSSVTASGGGASAESSLSLQSATNYSVTIGAGAPITDDPATFGANGNNSTFSSITSIGGGGGGAYPSIAGRNGGCGGGAGHGSGSPGSGTSQQGYEGGSGSGAQNYASAGGGGAGQPGGNISGANGGNGGNGVAVSITGSSVTYAGGGAGSSAYSTSGTPGTGGGGSVGNSLGGSGEANKGGGGGGAISDGGDGGSGGSGVVILRYPDTRTITIGAGLTGTESAASGGYKRATITAGTGNVSWS